MELLKELSEAAGIPGREENIRAIVMRELAKKNYPTSVDSLGNVVVVAEGKAKQRERVILAAHMDEIGFCVTHVDDKGFIRLHELGGFDTRNLFARRVLIHASNGPIPGILNPTGKPIHTNADDRRNYKEVSEFFVDTGMPGKKVSKLVRVGDMVTLDAPFREIGDYATGKCLDNRVQVFNLIRVMQQLKKPKNDVYAVFTVQEEVGLRGAAPGTFGVDPHIGLALDTTVAADVPGVAAEGRVTTLGGGVAIKVLDGSVICDRRIVDRLVELAQKGNIKHQMELLPRGGTDAGAIQRSRAGVRTGALSVPTRYLHTVTETVHKADVEATQQLLLRFLEG